MDARKLNAMWKAWKRRNRISKAIRIVIANIVAVPVYALFDKAGLGLGILARSDRCDGLLVDNPSFPRDPRCVAAHWESGNK